MRKKKVLLMSAAALWTIVPQLMRPIFCSQDYGKRDPALTEYRIGDSGVVNYLVAGTLNRPESAFNFMLGLPQLSRDTIMFVNYDDYGINYDYIADEIVRDINREEFIKVRLFAISIGCVLTEKVRNLMEHGDTWSDSIELETYLINPCLGRDYLRPGLRQTMPMLSALCNGLTFVTGPLRYHGMISSAGGKFSPETLSAQLSQVAWFKRDSDCRADYIILSEEDQLLDNNHICEDHPDADILTLRDVRHADTIGSASAYQAALELFFETNKDEDNIPKD